MVERKRLRIAKNRNIPRLPEPILEKILSRLNSKEAFRASILSRDWSNAFQELSTLKFDRSFFVVNSTNTVDSKRQAAEEKLILVGEVLSRQLNRYNASVESFWIEMPVGFYDKGLGFDMGCYIEQYVRLLLIQGSIKELVLRLGRYYFVNISEELYSARSLTKLELSGFEISPSACSGSGVEFPALKFLCLSLGSLKCPSERFLSCFRFLGSLHIGGSFLKLKKVELGDLFSEIKIQAPNLQHLSLQECRKGFSVLDINSCKSLTSLCLRGVNLIGSAGSFVIDTSLTVLETVEVASCGPVKKLQICNESLRHLCLSELSNLVEAEIDAPNLATFVLEDSVKSLRLSMHASKLQQVSFHVIANPEATQPEYFF